MKKLFFMAVVPFLMANATFANETNFDIGSSDAQEITVDEAGMPADIDAEDFWNPRPRPSCPQGRVMVTCSARDQRGRIYEARGCYYDRVQREAVRQCNQYSYGYCEPSGCRVGW